MASRSPVRPPAGRAVVTVGPMCRWVLPVSDFDAWVGAAKAGERTIYCRGQMIAHGSATVLLARELAAAKLLTLVQRAVMNDGAREFEFIAERVKCSFPAAPGGLSPRQADAAALPANEGRAGRVSDDDIEAVRVVLIRSANMGTHAPTNDEIARHVGLKDREAARYIVGLLIRAGTVNIEEQGPRKRRIVTNPATGKRSRAGEY